MTVEEGRGRDGDWKGWKDMKLEIVEKDRKWRGVKLLQCH